MIIVLMKNGQKVSVVVWYTILFRRSSAREEKTALRTQRLFVATPREEIHFSSTRRLKLTTTI
jgi:hypothetical protein